MNPSREQPRKKRGKGFSLEVLEERQLLSAGMGSTFAIMPGSVDKAGQISSVQFKLDPSQFTAGHGGKIVLGIDVAADPSTTLKPEIVSIKNASGRLAASVHHSIYTSAVVKAQKLATPISSAVLVTLPVPKAGQAPAVYTIQVQGQFSTTGKYLVGFYLPGDTNGDGTVNATDLQTIMSEFGSTPSSSGSKYTFDADVNRDGKISLADLQYASRNLGASTKVSPVIDVNLDPATDGPMHSRITNFRTVHFTGTATPGAMVTFAEINNNSPGATTTADNTGKYSIMVPLGDGSNTFSVTSKDAFGQSISGQISPVTYSLHPPVVINTPADLTSTSTATTTPTASTTAATTTSTSATTTPATSAPTGTG
jgi:hypothetical protein